MTEFYWKDAVVEKLTEESFYVEGWILLIQLLVSYWELCKHMKKNYCEIKKNYYVL